MAVCSVFEFFMPDIPQSDSLLSARTQEEYGEPLRVTPVGKETGVPPEFTWETYIER